MAQSVTEQQKRFFETFGYLKFPGLVQDDLGSITAEFEAVFQQLQIQHDGTKHSGSGHFVDQRAGLCALLDNPNILAAASGLLGDDFNYLGSDGNYYVGDTLWHPDGTHYLGKYVKFAFYLDSLTRDTGALRVIPGSHRVDVLDTWDARQAGKSEELWGIAQRDVPAVALETVPGDVVAFNHNLMHAAFGGSSSRRMFTLNLCRHASTKEEVKELRDHINSHSHYCVSLHSDIMRDTAGPERQRHLRQITELESDLPRLHEEKRRERQKEQN